MLTIGEGILPLGEPEIKISLSMVPAGHSFSEWLGFHIRVHHLFMRLATSEISLSLYGWEAEVSRHVSISVFLPSLSPLRPEPWMFRVLSQPQSPADNPFPCPWHFFSLGFVVLSFCFIKTGLYVFGPAINRGYFCSLSWTLPCYVRNKDWQQKNKKPKNKITWPLWRMILDLYTFIQKHFGIRLLLYFGDTGPYFVMRDF
jgi:hypothetical protein